MQHKKVPMRDNSDQLEALAALFTKLDRVLTGRQVGCVTTTSYHMAPAWSDGISVFLNRTRIDELRTKEGLVRAFGLNYHELLHLLHSPRSTKSPLADKIMVESLQHPYNLLEDQRIETLGTGTYPSIIPYLTSTFMRYCLSSETAWETNFVLAYGRRFIPVDIRDEFRRRFKWQALIPQIEEIVDEYRLLVFPTDEDRALVLIRQFNELLKQMVPVGDPHDHQNNRFSKGQPQGVRKEREAQEAAKQLDDAIAEQEEEEANASQSEQDDDGIGSGDAEQGEGEPEDGDGESEGGEAEDGEPEDGQGELSEDGTGEGDGEDDGGKPQSGDGEPEGDEASGAGDEVGEDGSSETGAPDGDSEPLGDNTNTSSQKPAAKRQKGRGEENDALTDDELTSVLNDVLEQAMEDPDLTTEVETAARLTARQPDTEAQLPYKRGTKGVPEITVEGADVAASRRFATVLTQLQVESDAGWAHGQPSGRLNTKAYIDGADFNEMWDRWEPGHNEATDIECVICVDTSTSMEWRIHEASRAAWSIKRALDTIDAKTTVLSFDDYSYVLYQKHEQVSRGTYRPLVSSGYTNPNDAVGEATRILVSSERATRIFIIITDGDWFGEVVSAKNDYMKSDAMIQQMNHEGITTGLAYIQTHTTKINRHNCSAAVSVDSPSKIVPFAKELTAKSVRSTMKRSK